ncbi:MAG: PQQ-binding-like beta-propeller repeat protein [Rubripirellula sp.]
MNSDLMRSGLLTVFLVVMNTTSVLGDDWAQWRGANRDAISQETGLLTHWPVSGPPLAWKALGLGEGFSSVSVANGRVFTLGDFDHGNYVIAVSKSDGSHVWRTKIGESGGHKKYKGPRSTPTVDGGQVFVLNQHSDLVCLDEKTGQLRWSLNLVDKFGGKMMSGWKYSESPLVDGGQVICTPGGSKGTLLALDRYTGEKIWQTSEWTDTSGYSSVIIATIGGKRQYVQLTGDSLAGVDPESGEVLWRADRQGKTAVVSTPVVADDIVFVTSGYGVGCNAFEIKNEGGKWSAEERYANTEIANHHGGVVLVDGHVFGSSGGVFRCLNVANGELAFEGRSVGKGATIYADGHLYLRGESGDVALIEATPEGLNEKSRFEQPDRSDEKAWPHPVIADGKLYLRDQDILLCYDLRAK